MQTLEQIIRSDLVQIVAGFMAWVVAALVLLLVLVVVLHTLYVLGSKNIFYKKPPVHGWSKRFYPASILLLILLLAIMWLLNVWSHSL